MPAAKRHFFILGMPRCRTAWLSVLLTHGNVHCFHEGINGCATFEDYVKKLREHPAEVVGDASPAMVFHIDRLLAEFPDARFLLLRRDPNQALASLLDAAPSDREIDRLCVGWPDYLKAVNRAQDMLSGGPGVYLVHSEYFEDSIQSMFEHCTGEWFKPHVDRYHSLKNLRITSTFPPVTAMPPLPKPEVIETPAMFDRAAAAGFVFCGGMAVFPYGPPFREMVGGWFKARKGADFPEAMLPPLGVVIHDDVGPAAALWCFETYGTGVAWIEFPITRPGLSAKAAGEVLAFAACALIELAGKGYEPPAAFNRFRVVCPPAMSRTLKRLGFQASEQRDNLILCI